MKTAWVIFGIFVCLAGLLCYVSTINFVIIPNIFSFLSLFNPFSFWIMGLGVLCFLVGLCLKGGD